MLPDKRKIIENIIRNLPELTTGQLYWVDKVIKVFDLDSNFDLKLNTLLSPDTLEAFGNALRIHHSFSSEPFSKDKFEYVLVQVMKMNGINASLAPKGNPGHDININGENISLKTQADSSTKREVIWISKFMELGRGDWGDEPSDLNGLREQFLHHLKNYNRILILRTLTKAPHWEYELVEIPKELLQGSLTGTLEMMIQSTQHPKPGYCFVQDLDGQRLYSLYFDGGTERKLQIKGLVKRRCLVHATWKFFIPAE